MNDTGYERSLLEEVTLDQWHALNKSPQSSFHEPSHAAQQRLREEMGLASGVVVEVAVEICMPNGERYGKRDVVAFPGGVGDITQLVWHSGRACARLNTWGELHYDRLRYSGIYDTADPGLAFVPCSDFLGAAVHRRHQTASRITAIWV